MIKTQNKSAVALNGKALPYFSRFVCHNLMRSTISRFPHSNDYTIPDSLFYYLKYRETINTLLSLPRRIRDANWHPEGGLSEVAGILP